MLSYAGYAIQEAPEFASGTSLQGYVTTTHSQLTRLFGNPYEYGPYEKVTTEWKLLIECVLVTIYDYKTHATPFGVYDWHIGGFSPEAAALVQAIVDIDSATPWKI